MTRMKQIATLVGAAFALGYGGTALAVIGSPGAVADAMLDFSNVKICEGNNLATACTQPINFGSPPLGGENAEVGVALNGVAVNPPAVTNQPFGTGFTTSATVGAGFVAGTILPTNGLPTGQYVGAYSSSSGNSLTGSSNVLIHSQTQLNTFGSDSSSTAEQNLTATFGVTTTSTQRFEMSFDMRHKLRGALGQDGFTVDASTNFSLTITQAGVGTIFRWAPNGTAGVDICQGNASLCVDVDPFNLNDSAGTNFALDDDRPLQIGYFEVEVTLQPGTYTFRIDGDTGVNAAIFPQVPEPGTIALLGLGLLGLGVTSRRRFA